MPTPRYLDCCAHPELLRLRTSHESNHDVEALLQCTGCQTFWFYRFHEYGDDLTSWFTQLTREEGELLRDSTGEVDLSFLATRPSWMDDNDGVRRVDRVPVNPWT